ncbi:hypothetical protein B0T17DRAFT_531294 [Bombardia bombarda]|uniref:Uncharacterized protein n=1 Tax=Bombardia bombarda TaxID=252184 RepID=A0AA39X064_9PEZI|nr:hypothetical protein B0T17DRAFT_531294 [Bombardia bombarda]
MISFLLSVIIKVTWPHLFQHPTSPNYPAMPNIAPSSCMLNTAPPSYLELMRLNGDLGIGPSGVSSDNDKQDAQSIADSIEAQPDDDKSYMEEDVVKP